MNSNSSEGAVVTITLTPTRGPTAHDPPPSYAAFAAQNSLVFQNVQKLSDQLRSHRLQQLYEREWEERHHLFSSSTSCSTTSIVTTDEDEVEEEEWQQMRKRKNRGRRTTRSEYLESYGFYGPLVEKKVKKKKRSLSSGMYGARVLAKLPPLMGTARAEWHKSSAGRKGSLPPSEVGSTSAAPSTSCSTFASPGQSPTTSEASCCFRPGHSDLVPTDVTSSTGEK
eukprot:CAMPEP_0178992602 /NCGR_PEP_ID=MMETSP0795-20121207/6209_1 /TAXON_ID=88552 /ORGANISM="Amoebophrya sp., Strain Ameob2" /LENGTH=224 /DNA_ID=CAMNT_0020684509 /DNA_START=191 /DNA_END=865 /DNA_ORIENTATION=+